MPFVTPDKRISLDNKGTIEAPGDLCYLAYKKLMVRWKAEPRWTTIHNLYRELPDMADYYWFRDWSLRTKLDHRDLITATKLAWEVFFAKHGMAYENKKIAENGDIDG